MLDISILSAEKVLKDQKSIEEFLTSTVRVYQKTDGVKLTVIKVANNGNLEDYIFSYKGNILYSGEYEYSDEKEIRKSSIGSSQFGLAFKHFQKLGKNSIPVGTELAIEFLMKKPTLSSNYERSHGLVLIGYSKTTYSERFGKIKSNPESFETEKRTTYANELKIDTPVKLFEGVLGNIKSFQGGIKSDLLKSEFDKIKFAMHWDSTELLLQDISKLFLEVESAYGGKEEGVVIYSNDKIFKFQQEYQLDKTARQKIKAKFKGNDEEESEYWKNVGKVSEQLANEIGSDGKLSELLSRLNKELKDIKLEFSHPIKTIVNIKDDIQVSTKNLIIKNMKGNNGCLILGKFRIFTKQGHEKLVKNALRKFDSVVICLVTSKENKSSQDLRLKALQTMYENNDRVHIIQAATGNLVTIINKSPSNINTVYAGSDRVESYQKQVKTMSGVNVLELPRNSDDISASRVIENLGNYEFFKDSVPEKIHKLYDEYLKVYGDNK